MSWFDAGPREADVALAFHLCTPVSVRCLPFGGAPWAGASVVVATARVGPLAARFARELSAAGARTRIVEVAELTGGEGASPIGEVARMLREQPGPRWLVWVSVPAVTPAAVSSVHGARTMAELACLRAAARGLVEGWEEHGLGGMIVVVGSGGGLDELGDPGNGALTGFASALGQEYPESGIAVVDVGDQRSAALASRIVGLGRPPAGHHELGLSGAGYLATDLVPVRSSVVDAGSAPPGTGVLDALREPDAAVVVSGDVSGIVARIVCSAAEGLAGPAPGQLFLLGPTSPVGGPSRRALDAVEVQAMVTRLRAAGIRVHHVGVDVRAARGMREFGERLRLDAVTVRTVVHIAGSGRSGGIADTPAGEWEAAVAAEVVGFDNLLSAAGDGVRLVIAHGSPVAMLGPPAGTGRSAANEYLARSVSRLRAERPGVVAQYVEWPLWEGLEVDDAAAGTTRFAGASLDRLPVDRGVAWASVLAGQAATLPARLAVLPAPVPPLARVALSGPSDRRGVGATTGPVPGRCDVADAGEGERT